MLPSGTGPGIKRKKSLRARNQVRHCEPGAGVAIHMPVSKASVDCFVVSLLAMTSVAMTGLVLLFIHDGIDS